MLAPLARALLRSPIGPPIRRLYRWVHPLTAEAKNARYDHETGEVIRRVLQPTSNAIDVGAHDGLILRLLVAQAPHGQHWAFEPLPGYAERLRAAFPGVHVHALALSDVAGPAPFVHVVSDPGYSGLQRRTTPRGDADQIEEVQVERARLDDLIPPTTPIALIKIDVEGGEYHVLRGARALLVAHRPVVIFEHGFGVADRYGAGPELVYDLLAACGLTVTLMGWWLDGRPPLTRAAFIRQYETAENFYFLAAP